MAGKTKLRPYEIEFIRRYDRLRAHANSLRKLRWDIEAVAGEVGIEGAPAYLRSLDDHCRELEKYCFDQMSELALKGYGTTVA
jgi:hypothetical protein